MNARWCDSLSLGRSGFVQSRLMTTNFPTLHLAEIEFHAPVYYVTLTRHVKGYVDNQLNGPQQFRTLEEAKAWATVVARFTY
jgi:hypothetical protein